jgi:hypothetical protein
LKPNQRTTVNLELEGGEGKVFLLLPEPISKVEMTSPPTRSAQGVAIAARVLGRAGILKASLPLQIDMDCQGVRQTVYATTKNGVLSWTAPFLKEFPAGPITVTVTDLASGKSVQGHTR